SISGSPRTSSKTWRSSSCRCRTPESPAGGGGEASPRRASVFLVAFGDPGRPPPASSLAPAPPTPAVSSERGVLPVAAAFGFGGLREHGGQLDGDVVPPGLAGRRQRSAHRGPVPGGAQPGAAVRRGRPPPVRFRPRPRPGPAAPGGPRLVLGGGTPGRAAGHLPGLRRRGGERGARRPASLGARRRGRLRRQGAGRGGPAPGPGADPRDRRRRALRPAPSQPAGGA